MKKMKRNTVLSVQLKNNIEQDLVLAKKTTNEVDHLKINLINIKDKYLK